jgi:hypothetical protein
MSYIVILMSFQTIYSINYGHNNKLSRLDAKKWTRIFGLPNTVDARTDGKTNL